MPEEYKRQTPNTDLGVKQHFAKFEMSKVRPERQAGNGPMKIWWEDRH